MKAELDGIAEVIAKGFGSENWQEIKDGIIRYATDEKYNNKFGEEDMIEASKYGYNFHKTTSFPQQDFEDSCVRNTQQWLLKFKNK
jgi:hypothetical protein